MTCRPFQVKDANGNVVGGGFVCSRGERKQQCKFCAHRPAAKLCDRPLEGAKAGKTCSAAMCVECAISIGPDLDLCPPHGRERHQKRKDARAWLDEMKREEDAHASCFCGELARVDQPCTVCRALPQEDHGQVDRSALQQMFPEWDRIPERDEPDPASNETREQRAHAVPIGEKVAHVKAAGQTRNHGCHWRGCDKQVPPAMWGCREHWYALPKHLRDRIWQAYRPGQEATLTPSREYLTVAQEVDAWIRSMGEDTSRESDPGSFERAARRAREREAVRKETRPAVDPRTGKQLYCSECHGKQIETPSGISCPNGHGDAPSLTEEEVWKDIGEDVMGP